MTEAELLTIDDPRCVAHIRFPVPAKGLAKLVRALEAMYGPGLILQQSGDRWLVLLPEGVSTW